MKNTSLTYDKYGFAVQDSYTTTRNSHLFINVYYISNNDSYEDFILTFECVKSGQILYGDNNIAKHRNIIHIFKHFRRYRHITVHH